MKYLAIFLILFIKSNSVSANFLEADTLNLIYTQKFSYNFSPDTKWVLTKANGEIEPGLGKIIDFSFSMPGVYVVDIEHVHKPESPGICDHTYKPTKIILNVFSHSLIFDFQTVKFSKKIIGGENTSGNTITIQVWLDSFDGKPVVYSYGKVRSAGVDTDIVGDLTQPDTILKPGINQLVFNLSGTARKNSYIMFDFVDVNGQIQSFSYLDKIE